MSLCSHPFKSSLLAALEDNQSIDKQTAGGGARVFVYRGGGGHVGVNIDPVATDAGSASSSVFDQQRARHRLHLPQGHCGKGTTVGSGRHICSQRQPPPPGSPCLFTSVSPTAVITALVFLLRCRQKALMGVARLQIPVLTFLIKSALSSRFILLHPSIRLAQCSHLRG